MTPAIQQALAQYNTQNANLPKAAPLSPYQNEWILPPNRGFTGNIYAGMGNYAPNQNPAYPTLDPFSSASSGGVSGTLQPYVNRMTQNANNALYGGLLGYQPQSIIAGNAGGTPVNSNPPQWRLPSAIPTPNQAQVGLLGPQANPQQQMGVFGNRSWMEA